MGKEKRKRSSKYHYIRPDIIVHLLVLVYFFITLPRYSVPETFFPEFFHFQVIIFFVHFLSPGIIWQFTGKDIRQIFNDVFFKLHLGLFIGIATFFMIIAIDYGMDSITPGYTPPLYFSGVVSLLVFLWAVAVFAHFKYAMRQKSQTQILENINTTDLEDAISQENEVSYDVDELRQYTRSL